MPKSACPQLQAKGHAAGQAVARRLRGCPELTTVSYAKQSMCSEDHGCCHSLVYY